MNTLSMAPMIVIYFNLTNFKFHRIYILHITLDYKNLIYFLYFFISLFLFKILNPQFRSLNLLLIKALDIKRKNPEIIFHKSISSNFSLAKN